MRSRTDGHRGVRADPVGFAWVVILASTLVIVIGLIGYLVLRVLPGPAAEPASSVDLPLPSLPAAPVPDPMPLPAPVPAR